MQLVRNTAVSWGHDGIRVNGVAQGLVKPFAKALSGRSEEKFWRRP